MRERVAHTKTEKTAWKLIAALAEACPCNCFVVAMQAPGTGYDIVPTGPIHSIDREVARKVIAAFAHKEEKK